MVSVLSTRITVTQEDIDQGGPAWIHDGTNFRQPKSPLELVLERQFPGYHLCFIDTQLILMPYNGDENKMRLFTIPASAWLFIINFSAGHQVYPIDFQLFETLTK